MSMQPGMTRQPVASTTSSASPSLPGALIRATRPSTISRSNLPLRPATGSITVPPLINTDRISADSPAPLGLRLFEYHCWRFGRRLTDAAGEQEEDGHAHGNAVGDLIHDQRGGAVGDVAGDLDTAIDRSGMEDHRLRPCQLQRGAVQTK